MGAIAWAFRTFTSPKSTPQPYSAKRGLRYADTHTQRHIQTHNTSHGRQRSPPSLSPSLSPSLPPSRHKLELSRYAEAHTQIDTHIDTHTYAQTPMHWLLAHSQAKKARHSTCHQLLLGLANVILNPTNVILNPTSTTHTNAKSIFEQRKTVYICDVYILFMPIYNI
jgi:hypothetical protein